jgi:hypothetical protein
MNSNNFKSVNFEKSMNEGNIGEKNFKSLAINRGFNVFDATKGENIHKHIDFHIEKDNKSFTVDVKAMKRVSRNDKYKTNDSIWIEFYNVQGKNGWIHGKQDCIAFEFEKDFIVVKRKDLLVLVNSLIDFKLEYVKSARDAEYRLYQRNGRKDCISIIKKNDLLKINYKVWNKD